MNTIRFFAILTVLMLAIALPTAFAAHHYHGYHGCGHGQGTSWDLSDRDTDSDGSLTFEEFSASQQEMLRSGFDMIDTDKDGKISGDEWNTFLKVHGMTPAS